MRNFLTPGGQRSGGGKNGVREIREFRARAPGAETVFHNFFNLAPHMFHRIGRLLSIRQMR